MKTQKLIVIGLIAVIAIVGIGIYIYADIQTQHGMTVEKYCEKYDCHIVEYKYMMPILYMRYLKIIMEIVAAVLKCIQIMY